MRNEDLFDLKDKIIVIPGGSGKVGSMICRALSEAGAKLIILGRDEEKGKKILNEIKNAYFYKCDISKDDEVKNISKEILNDFKKLDVLINCAAVAMPGRMSELTLDMWDTAYSINIKGAFLCVKYFGDIMINQNHGNIINIGSVYGAVSADEKIYSNNKFESSLIYATTKSALINFTRYIATHMAKHGIRANLLSPGGFINESNKDEFFRSNYCSRVPIGRMAEEDDLKGVIIFLASDASRYINGENIMLDGGWTSW